MLQAEGIQKSYHSKHVLSGVQLTAGRGACVGIVGRNGCGKSTLLAILAGAIRADGGSVRYQGQQAMKMPAVFAKMTAYVQQENPLMEELTARDNLLLWHRGNQAEFRENLESGSAKLLGIPEMLHVTVKKMSGGMKKRLSIACALTNHAPVLILDEPGASLDLECKEIIGTYIKTFTADGGLVLITSHELSELALCTELYVLKDGRLESIKNGLSGKELMDCF
ncbi:MAG: ABC transporter ATP-binding protein [Lachnospiraceae bacterium]|nr:ABC transporter ATP-binding protein [Lachnospiraceae bacterium]